MFKWYAKAYRQAPIPTIGGTLLAGGLTYFGLRKLFRAPDKVSPTFKKVKVVLPSGEKVDVQAYAKKVGFSPDPLATKLFNEMKGVSYTGWIGGHETRESAWKELYDLKDNVLVVAVYNAYNEIAKKKGEPHSLTQAIEDETAPLWSIKSKLVDKLKTLGLT